ncbi:MAG TPA: tetratricopeptide repeat protein, partial [Polyangia bacterium]|nr:tetratricopeptide repeat protein [Polyangia bacterium]
MAVNKDKVIASAQKYVEKGQYDKAIKEYLKVVQDDPKDIRIWLKVGDLYAKKGANGEAVETYERVAQTYSEQGFYLKAVAVYKQILKLEPRRVEVNLRLAELYKQLGLLSDAMQQFELAANFFSKDGRTRDSLDALKQIVEMDPDNVATRIKLAESFSKEGLNREAIEEFRRAADQLRAQNRVEDFVKVAERLAWHKPDDHALAKELAALYVRRQDPRRALTKLQTCFKADPRDPATLELLVEAFQALGQRQKVLSVLKELAKVLHENGQMEPRDTAYRRILELEPEDDEARRALGLGRKPARATEFVQAIPHREDEISAEIDEEALLAGVHPGASDVSDEILITDQDDGVAVEVADAGPVTDEHELARRRGPGAPVGVPAREPARSAPTRLSDAGAQLGGGENPEEEIARVLTETDVYIKYGLHDKAIDHLQQVFDRDPGNLPGHEKLKDLYVQTGRAEEAVQELLWLADVSRDARPEDAAQYLREALDLEPTNARARALLVEVTGRDEPVPVNEAAQVVHEELLPEDVGIEVEEPADQAGAHEFDQEDSSGAIELYPDEIEFEEEVEPDALEAAPLDAREASAHLESEAGPGRFGNDLAPATL